jgi:hypothetical protein
VARLRRRGRAEGLDEWLTNEILKLIAAHPEFAIVAVEQLGWTGIPPESDPFPPSSIAGEEGYGPDGQEGEGEGLQDADGRQQELPGGWSLRKSHPKKGLWSRHR